MNRLQKNLLFLVRRGNGNVQLKVSINALIWTKKSEVSLIVLTTRANIDRIEEFVIKDRKPIRNIYLVI